ncbi:motility associated factor glycosyltransferase family protein [Mucilaginibacter paludis]|uniref:DUF115 domain-containing protein n=1 Tax=Mucilaginibacter paludis DSM 18603 TaxID=714943 RepID=H1Y0I6_9SPHI|nr:hypothetical protein [Mucilaginibacter paludis]EHQ28453.1 hypothetical protein Mucpa_4363 [Mucilaginibacter paludis DSM 18603]
MQFKDDINPYKKIFGDIYRAIFQELANKILWDLNPESRRSAKKFLKLKDSQKGKKAVMMFNGPSLLKTNFSLLGDVFTMGLNKINLITEELGFSPSIIIAFDILLNRQNADFLKNSEKFLKIINYHSLKDLNKTAEDLIYLYYFDDNSFNYNPARVLSNQGSTPFIAFQIAYFMGFQEIAIIGADHNFPDIKPLAIVKNEEEDKFHFHKDYHKKGESNQYPDKIKLDMIFRDVGLAFEEKGRKIYNATEGGKLEIFERISLEEFLRKP